MKNFYKITVFIALIAIIVFSGTACSKKEGGAASVGRASPASDFSYKLTTDGKGIIITGYTGNGGAVVIPSAIEDIPVLEIGNMAFRGGGSEPKSSDSITSIAVPDSVIKFETSYDSSLAFNYMANLNSVRLPDGIKHIPIGTFSNNKKLKKVNLPASLESIGVGAFAGCVELSELEIPASLTKLEIFNPSNLIIKNILTDCEKLPIKTRQRLLELGLQENF